MPKPKFKPLPFPGTGQPLRWSHLLTFLAFVGLNQGLSHLVSAQQDRRLAQTVEQPAPVAGTSLHQRLLDQAQRAHVPLVWTAHDPLAERPALAAGGPLRGPVLQTATQTIATERLRADALHRPLPEVEACLDGGILVVRDLTMDPALPCDARRPYGPPNRTSG